MKNTYLALIFNKTARHGYIMLCFLVALTACQLTPEQQAVFDPEKAAIARLKLGLGFLHQAQANNKKTGDEINQAHLNLSRAQKYSPNNPHVMLGLALFDQHIGEHQEAKQIYEAIVAIEPYNGLFKIHYGTFLCATKHYNEAKKQFEGAISLNQSRWKADALTQLGYCAAQHNKTLDADKAFKQLFDFDKNKVAEVSQAANSYKANGDTKTANYLFKITKANYFKPSYPKK